ncbi:uncharacterized protein EI90DRAFT_3040944 [Cantharellus anzutake]|uniref:uncharacterized protein n=1 Tax=Cantharellus anzutake TaxID=1750568 RepID=UPI001906C5E6|nr:uncharacterized protein EI90DRAFT_3040944 [Cantharellus anzutake]KAF8337888.1 hypothetical protein EI90DRAFT_3040944 [Cantharellus anzutake]
MRTNLIQIGNSLHRSLLGECAQFPYPYLSLFWRVRVSDVYRAGKALSRARVRLAKNELKLLQKANRGELGSVRKVLEYAYGRRGKLRHELFEVRNRPTPHIPSNPNRSRPPTLSPATVALSNSTYGRETGKRVGKAEFEHPPNLPQRAIPSSEDARLLGPFSRRRLVNLRWKFFKLEKSRLLPPLRIKTEGDPLNEQPAPNMGFSNIPFRAQPEAGAGSLGDARVGPCSPGPSSHKQPSSMRPFGRSLRFFRRRHQEILRLLPIMVKTPQQRSAGNNSQTNRIYEDPFQPWKILPPMIEDDRRWVKQAGMIILPSAT